MASFVWSQPGEERRHRLAHLEINRAVLDLHDYVVVELAVERMKIVVRRFGAIVLQVAPVEMMVVDERAVKNHAAMRLERAGDHIGRVGMSASVGRRTGAPLGVGFDYKSAEIGNLRGRSRRPFFATTRPPADRVDRTYSSPPDLLSGCSDPTEIDKLHAPWTERFRNPLDLRYEIIFQNSGRGVHVVDGAAADSNRSQQAARTGRHESDHRELFRLRRISRPAVASLDACRPGCPID